MQEHEHALIDAIAGLADTSDGEIGNNNKSRASRWRSTIFARPSNITGMMEERSVTTPHPMVFGQHHQPKDNGP
ncbi:hypothetical protein YC2023_062592 [Brassica napus]